MLICRHYVCCGCVVYIKSRVQFKFFLHMITTLCFDIVPSTKLGTYQFSYTNQPASPRKITNVFLSLYFLYFLYWSYIDLLYWSYIDLFPFWAFYLSNGDRTYVLLLWQKDLFWLNYLWSTSAMLFQPQNTNPVFDNPNQQIKSLCHAYNTNFLDTSLH